MNKSRLSSGELATRELQDRHPEAVAAFDLTSQGRSHVLRTHIAVELSAKRPLRG